MDHIHIEAVIDLILAIWAGYIGFMKIREEKDIIFGGLELLLFVIVLIFNTILLTVPDFWKK